MEVRSVQVRKGTVTIGIEGEAAADDGSMARKGVSSSLVAGLDWAGTDMQAKPRQGKARQGEAGRGEQGPSHRGGTAEQRGPGVRQQQDREVILDILGAYAAGAS